MTMTSTTKTACWLVVVCTFLLSCSLPMTARASDTWLSQSSAIFANDAIPTMGDIDDTQCNIEDLERANDSQLHAIFRELQQTNFFRHFVVDLERKCPLSTWNKAADGDQEEDEEEEFDCHGGDELGLDEDAEPLCTVDIGGAGADDANPFGDPFGATVLHSLSEHGFSSQGQQDTFAWDQQTDMIAEEDTPCDTEDDNDLPETFWMDMCSSLQSQEGNAKLVNLALNPERNTGYNGTHIWRAIYEENCISTSDACLEERVLYRLLSGLHTSTTLSIAKNYYPPSKRKGRVDWESNPQYFMEKFQHHPEHVRNLHFSYVVMLRAIRKASEYLYDYDIQSGNYLEDQASQVLLKRLLDTAILRSCSSVFSAFDESLMFQESNDFSLQQNFKGVFHNISSVLDCVQCQQCKLHGKMGMMGYGTALKILFLPTELIELEPNEVVGLMNTAARLSESLVEVRELTSLYWEQEREKMQGASVPVTPGRALEGSSATSISVDALDKTVGVIASLGHAQQISLDRERELVELALEHNPELLILGKHYYADPQRFLAVVSSIGRGGASYEEVPDAIIVGSGLAGLAAALNLLDRGGTVTILEKEHLLGGNSNKASSGINGCCPQNDTYGDSILSFKNDTIRSAGDVADLDLIDTLVQNSEGAIHFLQQRAKVDLSLLAQLGGHSHKRTHRPSNGMAGAEIIYQMQKAVRAYEKAGKVKILVDTKVTDLQTEDGRVVGVTAESTLDGTTQALRADNVVLATGGFASDRSSGSYLDQYRPELMSFPATAGGFSTGDGISLATGLGAVTRDMEKVQIHPTGWVDPTDPKNPTKTLAAELMRGVGGILVNKEGNRFCNELGTRAYVTDKMLHHSKSYAKSGQWDVSEEVPTFHLILSSAAAADAQKHVDLYSHKGLLNKVEGLSALAKHTGIKESKLKATIETYRKDSTKGVDEYGKVTFRGLPIKDLSKETFYVGTVSPVLHYCMGGLKIDPSGNVLKEDGSVIEGLHAAGEVTGGVHGNNRLGGNSLLECTVFGTIVGQKLPVKKTISTTSLIGNQNEPEKIAKEDLPLITMDELSKHNTEDDIWVAVHGVVYDFTEFAHEHPAGFASIFELAGTDGTAAFAAVHNTGMLDDFDEDRKGLLEASS
eukprot:Nitzschia sp. Nitz4//scaffold25_size161228//17957//21361//NITZ4_002415-RA/size161228-processed-gene-0.178-mRNA-1//-1//CDS//3329544541//5112//frame0